MFWYAKAIGILAVFNFLMFVFSALSVVFRTALRVGYVRPLLFRMMLSAI